MRLINFILIFFLILTNGIKADNEINTFKNLKKSGNLIFIRHAYAPGGGDPNNFNINDCSTQRNLNFEGKKQSERIGDIIRKLKIDTNNVYSSQWCRCKETAKISFERYKELKSLNSFFDPKFAKNKKQQIRDLKKFIKNWDNKKDLILVTHYVVILDILDIATNSGDIVFFDKKYNVIKVINTLK